MTASRTLAALLVALAASTASAQSDPAAPSDKLALGTPAPAFVLQDLRGGEFDLSRHAGKAAVVLSFWSIYCDSCVEEMLSLQKLEDKYQGKGLVIVAINEDIRVPRDRIRRFLERLEKFRGRITYPILFDQDSRVFTAYRGDHLPTLILVDAAGKVAASYRGYDPGRERELLRDIEAMVTGAKPPAVAAEEPAESPREVYGVTGEAVLCGFFDETGWRKSFTGSESRSLEMEITRDLARRDATRQALVEALRTIGIRLYANEPRRDCLDGAGIHLDRDPFNTHDPLSNLLNLVNYSEFFETVSEQEMLIGNRYLASRRVRADLDNLQAELESMGYVWPPLKIQFTYVNMSPLDQREFLLALLNQSKFVAGFEPPVFTAHSTSQAFEVHTSSQGFADEILRMDFGLLKIFVEQVTPANLELEIWK